MITRSSPSEFSGMGDADLIAHGRGIVKWNDMQTDERLKDNQKTNMIAALIAALAPPEKNTEALAAEIIRPRAREKLLLAVKDAAREVYDKGGTVESEWNALGYVLDAFEKWEKANG